MADFGAAYSLMLKNEGGLVLHRVPGDRGGLTFGGISQRAHPSWYGWSVIETRGESDPRLPDFVRAFYRAHYWDRVAGDDMASQLVANSVFDFAVNAGCRVAVRLAQVAAGVKADGWIGPVTVAALGDVDPEAFADRFALAKIARYSLIVERDRSQRKFLWGWVRRVLTGVES